MKKSLFSNLASLRNSSLLILAALTILSGCGIDDTNTTNTPPRPDGDFNPTREVVLLVNEARANGYTCASGQYPATSSLEVDDKLVQAADKHSNDMADNGFFAHESPTDGTAAQERVTNAGYDWRGIGENLAHGSVYARSPQRVIDDWLGSTTGHCEALMDRRFSNIGVAVVDYEGNPYWTAVFAAPK